MVRALVLLRWGAAVAALAALTAVSSPQGAGGLTAVLRAERARSLGGGLLAAALASHHERTAVRAALAIGRTKLPVGEPLLVAHLHDARPAVRAMSVYGLGLIASGRRTAAILAALNDANSAVRAGALDAVDRYAAASLIPRARQLVALEDVARRLRYDTDPAVRARAAATLESFAGTFYAPLAAATLVDAANGDRAREVRRFAAWSIFRGYASLVPEAFLARMLRDRDEVVRIEAVRAIGKRDDVKDLALVLPLLRDPSWRVQEQTAETIRLLHGLPLTQHWTRIPAYVHVPAPRPDPLRALPALARTPVSGRPRRPQARDAILQPALDPTTAAAMDGPAPGPHPRVRIVTTQGNLYVTLFPEWAPLTVENFLALANRGYYDANRWFRIVPDFVVQTGDPNDNGNGDAGYAIGAEENPVMQGSYVVSMGMNYTNGPNAHAIRDSAGTQYYITLSPQLHLDRDFTVFGRVTSGFGVLGRLVESDRVLRVERVADQRL